MISKINSVLTEIVFLIYNEVMFLSEHTPKRPVDYRSFFMRKKDTLPIEVYQMCYFRLNLPTILLNSPFISFENDVSV